MSRSDEEDICVVLDNGSYRIKAGFAGDDAPRSVFRTVVGTPLYERGDYRSQAKCYVGSQVVEMMDVVDIRKPIERGIITDWGAMEIVWDHVFDDLSINISDLNVLVSETSMNPKSNREKIIQIMCEKFQPRGMYVISPNVLSLYSPGRTTGLVIDSGYEVTVVWCIYEGYKVTQSMFRSDIGGNDVTNYLIELLGKRGYAFTTAKEIEEVNMMKERCAYVSPNPGAEKVDDIKKDYTCSNGTTVCLGYERFQCMEAMFNPSMIGSKACGIQELIVKSIQACPVDVIRDFYLNVILTGSNTMASRFVYRLEQELRALLPASRCIKIVAPPERHCSTWIGGSILGSLSSTRTMWITPVDYDEFGPNIVYKPEFPRYW